MLNKVHSNLQHLASGVTKEEMTPERQLRWRNVIDTIKKEETGELCSTQETARNVYVVLGKKCKGEILKT